MSVQEIETAITQLSPKELTTLKAWLDEYHAQVWDRQIEDDLEAGRLDTVLAQVEQEYQTGLTKPL